MGDFMKTNGGFVVDRPGRVLFVPVKADGTLDYANAIRNTAKINQITATNSKTKTDIPDGNDFYPAGSRVTAISGTIAIDFSTIDPMIWAMVSGSTLEKEESGTMMKIYDYMPVSENGKIEIEGDMYKTNGFINILGSDGTQFEKVTGDAVTAGEYSVSASGSKTTLTFSNEDKGKNVAITMEITTKTVSYSQGKKSMKNHKLFIDTEFSTLSDTDKIPVNIEISQVSVGGDMVDALTREPSTIKTLTFNMYAPRPGEKPYKVKMGDKTVE